MKKDKSLQNTASDLQKLSATFRDAARKSDELARDLEQQARRAREEANALKQKAEALEYAHQLVNFENRVNLVTPQLDKKLAKAGKDTRIVFLIDGSGSMQMNLNPGLSYSASSPLEGETPIAYAVGAAVSISQKVVENNGKVETLMFGDMNPPWVDLLNLEDRNKVIKGLNSGTDFHPALQKLAATVNKSENTHIVILSDGDIFDNELSKKILQELLDNNPKLTLGLVEITGHNNPNMSRMISSLATEGRENRIAIHPKATSFEEVTLGAGAILANRLAEQEKADKAAAKKRKPPANPKP